MKIVKVSQKEQQNKLINTIELGDIVTQLSQGWRLRISPNKVIQGKQLDTFLHRFKLGISC